MSYEDTSNPFFSFRNDICVSCARCVRACEDIQGTNALTMAGRGFWTLPVAGAASLRGSPEGFATSNCVSCGACVKECPTGALTEKTVLEQGDADRFVRTTCAYCGVGCAFDAGVRDGQVVQMIPADDGPSNLGHACMKGRFGWTYITAGDLVRTPLLREGSAWKEISWEAALDRIAQEFSRIKAAHGPDALATISSRGEVGDRSLEDIEQALRLDPGDRVARDLVFGMKDLLARPEDLYQYGPVGHSLQSKRVEVARLHSTATAIRDTVRYRK